MPGVLSSKVLSSRGLGHEPLRRELLGGALDLQLLPRVAYSARDPLQWQSLGLSLERQQGVHAIGSDRREDFDSWPGTLALTPAGVEVFSESPQGGEYLLLRWLADPRPWASPAVRDACNGPDTPGPWRWDARRGGCCWSPPAIRWPWNNAPCSSPASPPSTQHRPRPPGAPSSAGC